jgi:hypothetical protein
MLGVAMGVLVLARTWTTTRAAVRAGTLAVCLLVVAGVAESGTLASHRTTGDVAHVFFVRVFPFPSRVAWFARHGMPEQRQIDRLAASTSAAPGVAKVVALTPGDRTFAELEGWLHAHGTSAYLEWMVTHPWSALTEPLRRPERSYNFAHGNLTFYAAPNDLASPLTPLAWPPLAALGVLVALAGYLAVRHRTWRHPSWRVLAVVTAVGLPAVFVAWSGDGQEVTRHTVEGFAELRLGIWILVVLGLLVRPSPPNAGRRVDVVAEPVEGAEPTALVSADQLNWP